MDYIESPQPVGYRAVNSNPEIASQLFNEIQLALETKAISCFDERKRT